MENLRLKPREALLNPPDISLSQGPSPEEAARQMREAFLAADELHEAAQVISSTTADKIRSAGFDGIPNPTRKLPNSYRVIHSDGVAGFNDENCPAVGRVHGDVRTRIMILHRVTLIDQRRRVIATVQVAEQDGACVGHIDLSLMPVPLRRLFEEYEEIVNTQVFSLLDEIEEKIENLQLKVVFEDGSEAVLVDVQIRVYPD